MREFLALWIIIQLFLIGGTVGMVRYQTSVNKYDCGKGDDHAHDELIGMILPLVVFVPPDQMIEKYCEGKR